MTALLLTALAARLSRAADRKTIAKAGGRATAWGYWRDEERRCARAVRYLTARAERPDSRS